MVQGCGKVAPRGVASLVKLCPDLEQLTVSNCRLVRAKALLQALGTGEGAAMAAAVHRQRGTRVNITCDGERAHWPAAAATSTANVLTAGAPSNFRGARPVPAASDPKSPGNGCVPLSPQQRGSLASAAAGSSGLTSLQVAAASPSHLRHLQRLSYSSEELLASRAGQPQCYHGSVAHIPGPSRDSGSSSYAPITTNSLPESVLVVLRDLDLMRLP